MAAKPRQVEFNEIAVAKLAAADAEGSVIHMQGHGWLGWDGQRWTRGADKSAREFALKAVESRGGTKSSQVSAVLREMASLPEIARSPDILDADPMMVNTPRGIFILSDGPIQELPHMPGAYCTHITGASPRDRTPEARNIWLKFLTDTLGQQRHDYVQRFLGYALSGLVHIHHIMMFVGPPGAGKTTLLDAVAKAMGSYALKFNAEVLMQQTYRQHETELLQFRGARLAWAGETDRSARWNTARVNDLTGETTISGRYMRQDQTTYQRSHKTVILGNFEPAINDPVGDGIVRRLRIVRFTRVPDTPDSSLPDRLAQPDVQGAILDWLAAGCQLVLREGDITVPDAVRQDTEGYFTEQDEVGLFLDERTQRIEGTQIMSSDLWSAWKDWCEMEGIPHPGTMRRLIGSLKRRGWQKARDQYTRRHVIRDLCLVEKKEDL